MIRMRLWNQKRDPVRAVDTACEANRMFPGDQQFFRWCMNGLAQNGRCEEFKVQWNKNEAQWPDPKYWEKASKDLLQESNAAGGCLRK